MWGMLRPSLISRAGAWVFCWRGGGTQGLRGLHGSRSFESGLGSVLCGLLM